MSRPTDIAFDHAGAAEAIGALDRASAVLADVTAGRVRAGATARQRFRGTSAEDFDRADHALGVAAGDARSAVTALRHAIAEAARAAQRAQAVRADDQRAWDEAHAHPPPVGAR